MYVYIYFSVILLTNIWKGVSLAAHKSFMRSTFNCYLYVSLRLQYRTVKKSVYIFRILVHNFFIKLSLHIVFEIFKAKFCNRE